MCPLLVDILPFEVQNGIDTKVIETVTVHPDTKLLVTDKYTTSFVTPTDPAPPS